jgi:hypothetical protein
MNARFLKRLAFVFIAVLLPLLLLSCASQEKVSIKPSETTSQVSSVDAVGPPTGKIDPIARYGGYVLTATTMPHDRGSAYYWAKHIGTLVAYETFLRKYSDGGDAQFFREEIRKRFIPQEEEWREAWLLYSKMEIIEGAICDPTEGFILMGRPGTGRLPPFFYEDLITALKCSISKEKVGVTMNRIFKSRFNQPEDPRKLPHEVYETSVDFYSKKLWNTHMAYLLFEGDRMLKTLAHGYDIFLKEPVRAHVPGFQSIVEMAANEPPEPGRDTGKYGRIWIELTSVKINTTEKKNVAMFSDVRLDVRAESKNEPPLRFAAHLRTNYTAYGEEFLIFAEVERAARTVAIARWLAETYPETAQKLVDASYENAKVFVPQVIPARIDFTHDLPHYKQWLVGGVVFPNVNKKFIAKDAKVAETPLDSVEPKVLEARAGKQPVWEVAFGKRKEDKFVAWCVSAMQPGKAMSSKVTSPTQTEIAKK